MPYILYFAILPVGIYHRPQVKAYSGMLQAVPGVVFTLLAGPLSDRYGRRPLLIAALAGYVILQLVFLVNSIWLEELAVEYLLLECLQVSFFVKVFL